MKKISITSFLAAAVIAFSCYSIAEASTVKEKTDTVMVINGKKFLVKINRCNEKHPDGCHTGGDGSSSCKISSGYYSCLGTLGGDCGVSCIEGYYACCGTHCYCKEIPKKAKNSKK